MLPTRLSRARGKVSFYASREAKQLSEGWPVQSSVSLTSAWVSGCASPDCAHSQASDNAGIALVSIRVSSFPQWLKQ